MEYDKYDSYDKLIKIILIGDSCVGKSNILSRFINNDFIYESKSTIGVEFGTRTLTVNNIKIKAQIWDTAGQERYQSIIRAYYRGSHGVLLIYDITNQNSFDNIKKWYNEINKYAPNDIKIMLIGNKSDLINDRKIAIEEGSMLSRDIKSLFIETSALNNTNIDLAFNKLIEYICEDMFQELIKSNDDPLLVPSNNIIIIRPLNDNNDIIKSDKNCCK